MNTTKNILIILLSILIIWLLIKPNNPDIQLSERRADKIIKEKVHKVKALEAKIEYKWINNTKLEKQYITLLDSVEYYKQARDTIQIIKAQDTVIKLVIQSNDTLKSIISLKDSIILNQSDIIGLKDTIIISKDFKLKKARRRNIVLGLVSVGLGFLLFKI